jgi:lipopolysaccharide/colanic/teichoic acid biosynthesis glycosyltransferase
MSTRIGEVHFNRSPYVVSRPDVRGAVRAKRILDIAICLVAAPLTLLIGLLIAFFTALDGGAIFYSQTRIGKDGRPFSCLKFRSMVIDADARLEQVLAANVDIRREWELYQKLADDPRITRFGNFIRTFSLDELPQLINVWRGEMSIVGPRPIMADQIALYGEQFGIYCAMRPGITGLWQISGRNETTFAERVRLDTQYVKAWSFLRDIEIVLLTLPAVMERRGAR